MQRSRCHILAALPIIGLLAAGQAFADNPRPPRTGSEQGMILPNAIPGGEAPHGGILTGHLIAPSGQTPQTGSTQGIQPPNSIPGNLTLGGEAQPHSDVMSPRGVVPQSNEGAPR